MDKSEEEKNNSMINISQDTEPEEKVDLVDLLPEDVKRDVKEVYDGYGYESPESFIIQSARLHISDLNSDGNDIRYNSINDGFVHFGYNNYSNEQYMLSPESHHLMFSSGKGVIKLWASRLSEWLRNGETLAILSTDNWYDNLQKLNIPDIGANDEEWALSQSIINERTQLNPIDVRKPYKPPSTLKGEHNNEFKHVIKTPVDKDKYTKEQYMRLSENFYGTMEKYGNLSLSQKEIKTLLRATRIAYSKKGIKNSFKTHDKESPTIRDVLDVLTKMATEPSSLEEEISSEAQERSAEVLEDLESFVGGKETEELTKQTKDSLLREKVNWLDLSQLKKKEHFMILHASLINVYLQACEREGIVHILIEDGDRLLSEPETRRTIKTMLVNGPEFDVYFTFGSEYPHVVMENKEVRKIVTDYIPHIHYYEGTVSKMHIPIPNEPLKEFDATKSSSSSEMIGCVVKEGVRHPIRVSPDRLEAPHLGRNAYAEFFDSE